MLLSICSHFWKSNPALNDITCVAEGSTNVYEIDSENTQTQNKSLWITYQTWRLLTPLRHSKENGKGYHNHIYFTYLIILYISKKYGTPNCNPIPNATFAHILSLFFVTPNPFRSTWNRISPLSKHETFCCKRTSGFYIYVYSSYWYIRFRQAPLLVRKTNGFTARAV